MDNERLFEIFEERHLTYEDVSEGTDISPGNLSDWKNGRSNPKASSLIKIADYLGCSIDYLLGKSNEERHININEDVYKKFHIIQLDELVVKPFMKNKKFFVYSNNFAKLKNIYEKVAEDCKEFKDEADFLGIFQEEKGGYSIKPVDYVKLVKVHNKYSDFMLYNSLKAALEMNKEDGK